MSTTQTISRAAKRILGGELLEKGYSVEEIADITGTTIRTVFNWKAKIKQGGNEALIQTEFGGRQYKLTEQQIEELKTILQLGAVAAGYPNERWYGKRIKQIIEKRYGVVYNYKYIPQLVRRIGFSYQKPHTRSPKRSQEAIEQWPQQEWETVKKSGRRRFDHYISGRKRF